MARKNRRATIVHERSVQARKNERLRIVKDLPSYDDRHLDKLTIPQLRSLAKSLGKVEERKRAQLVADYQKEYYNVPKLTLSKFEKELARRPLISSTSIAQAPVKVARLMRQQQRRRLAARNKLERIHQYDALREKRSIELQRQIEKNGLSGKTFRFGDSRLGGLPEQNNLINTVNVLSNDKFVKSMDARTLKKEIQDSAKKVGKKTSGAIKSNRSKKKRQKQSKSRFNKNRDFRLRQIGNVVDKATKLKLNKLNKKQFNFLMIATGFRDLLTSSVHYDENEHQFVSDIKDDKYNADVKQQINDYISQARQVH